MNDRLYRSPTDRVIAGVAGGMATWLNIDPSLIRIAWVLLAILSGGIFVVVYIVMMIVVPLPPPGWVPQRQPGSASGWAGWGPSGSAATGSGGGPPPAGDPAPSGGPPPPGSWGSPPPATDGWGSQPPNRGGWDGRNSGRGAGMVLGAVLILLGVWFLVDRYVHVDWSTIWPIALVVLGIGLMLAAIRRTPPAGDH